MIGYKNKLYDQRLGILQNKRALHQPNAMYGSCLNPHLNKLTVKDILGGNPGI